jgi:hypothetical protein
MGKRPRACILRATSVAIALRDKVKTPLAFTPLAGSGEHGARR